jgi:uncharacterized membrane protein
MVAIPIRENGEFDLEKQKEIASKYEQIEKIKDRIRITKEDIDEKSIRFEYNGTYSEVSISQVFELQR